MLLATEFRFGAVVFQTYIADLVTWPIDRSPSTKSKIAKELHKNFSSSFGGTDKPPLESKVKYLVILQILVMEYELLFTIFALWSF